MVMLINNKNKMTNLKNLLLTGIGVASLALTGCGNKKDNQKYQNFPYFVIKEGEKDSDGDFNCCFLRDNKRYSLWTNPSEDEIWFFVQDQKAEEYFKDEGLNGLDRYGFRFDGEEKNPENLLSEKNKIEYEMLIDSIPKWYEESQKQR